MFDRVFASGSLDALRKGMARGDSIRAYAGYAGTERPSAIWDTLIERFSGDWASLH